MIKGDLFQKMYKYSCWLKEYKSQLSGETIVNRIPTNPELDIICAAVDKTIADCLKEDADDPGVKRLIGLLADVKELMSKRAE